MPLIHLGHDIISVGVVFGELKMQQQYVSEQQKEYLFFETSGRTQREILYDWTDHKQVLSVLFPTLLRGKLPGCIPRHHSLLSLRCRDALILHICTFCGTLQCMEWYLIIKP